MFALSDIDLWSLAEETGIFQSVGSELLPEVPKVTTPRKKRTSESSNKMLQMLANPESGYSPENNDPPKVETSKLISLFAKNNNGLMILQKCHTDPRFINNDYLKSLLVRLKVPDLLFFQKYSFHIFCDLIF